MIARRGLAIGIAALSLAAVGCSSSDDDDAGGGDADTTTTITAGTDGTAAPTTGEMATTTTEGAGDDLLATAEGLAGEWTGTWFNEMFGSTGDIAATFAIDADARTVDVSIDLGGNVLGGTDPDAETFSIPIDPGTYEGTSPLFGDYSLTTAADGSFEVSSTGMPLMPSGTVTASGTITDTTLAMTYEVDFGDGSPPATGTFDLAKG